MKLSTAQEHWLKWLRQNGGSAYIDGHHMYANGERTKMGSEIAWLQLVVKGCVVAKNQRLVISDYGFRHLGIEPPPAEMLPCWCPYCGEPHSPAVRATAETGAKHGG